MWFFHSEKSLLQFKMPYCSASWVLHGGLMKYLKKHKWRSRSKVKWYESEKNIRDYVGKCKYLRKRRKKIFQNLLQLEKQPMEMFWKISQNSQENTSARGSFLIKLKNFFLKSLRSLFYRTPLDDCFCNFLQLNKTPHKYSSYKNIWWRSNPLIFLDKYYKN